MKTSMLIVEILVGGILVTLAFGFLVVSLSPDGVRAILDEVQGILSDLNVDSGGSLLLLLLSSVFVAIAYTVGVLSEPIARDIFEWKFNRIKKECLKKFLKENRGKLGKSPILEKYAGLSPTEIDKKVDAVEKTSYGLMRFRVMMENPGLYQDIASHLHRYRLMRILFLALVIFIIAVFHQRCLNPSSLLKEMSTFCTVVVILVAIAVVDILIILDRFKRYCGSVERSYKVLVLDQEQDTDMTVFEIVKRKKK